MTTGKPTPDKPVSRLLLLLAAIMLITCTMGIARGETTSPPAIPMVSFVFDDGNDTDYLVGRELFAAHGAVASSAVTTGFINTVDHMTPDQILALQRAGWEIMGHTVTHPNLRSLSPEAIDAELSQSKAELERLGVTVTNMVYPYNKNDDTVREVASRYYRSGRGGTNAFNVAGVDPYYLKSFALKHDVERMKGLIDTAVSEGKWLVIYQHEIDAKVKVSDYDGSFRKGETVRLSPSGAIARFTTTHWFPLYGYALYLVPLSGTPRPGDTVSGMSSGARATIDRIVYNEREQLGDMLSYLRNSHPTVPVVTIDKGLDLLGVPRFQGGKHAQR